MTVSPEKRAELLRLAKRVEGLAGPDREVDCLIWCATGVSGVPFAEAAAVVPDFGKWLAPAYTASLDAAMTLVPERLWQRINVDPNGRANVRLGNACAVTAATTALALVAAALRARAAIAPIEGDQTDA
jgi:hypothetical protein